MEWIDQIILLPQPEVVVVGLLQETNLVSTLLQEVQQVGLSELVRQWEELRQCQTSEVGEVRAEVGESLLVEVEEELGSEEEIGTRWVFSVQWEPSRARRWELRLERETWRRASYSSSFLPGNLEIFPICLSRDAFSSEARLSKFSQIIMGNTRKASFPSINLQSQSAYWLSIPSIFFL